MVICLERDAADATATPLSLLFHCNPDWLTFVVLAYPGCPGKEAVKRMSDCLLNVQGRSIIAGCSVSST